MRYLTQIILNIVITTTVLFVAYFFIPVSWLDRVSDIFHPRQLGSTITSIAGSDTIASSRSVINTNFSNLNTDKLQSGSTATSLTVSGLLTANDIEASSGNLYLQGSSANALVWLQSNGNTTIQGSNVSITGLTTLTLASPAISKSSILTTDGSSLLIATGTQLTVGNILATTTATNIFRGSVSIPTIANATTTLTVGCISTYPTSSATQIKQIYNTSATSTSINGATVQGVVLWAYGACP